MSIDWIFPDPATTLGRAARFDLQAARPRASDVVLYQTNDGGEIKLLNGVLVMADGLYTALYLSMFGGNEDDGGLDAHNAVQWWGNLSERVPARRYRSQTQHILRSMPAIPANLRTLEEAVAADTAWLVGDYLDAITPAARIPALNRVAISLRVESAGNNFGFNVTDTWSKAA